MAIAEPFTTPFHLTGNYRPVTVERTDVDLEVHGTLPPELRGTFIRNGPNPVDHSGHWFLGDGMLHGIHLEDGAATWYRNRWVRTASFTGDATFVDERGRRDHTASKANTSVVRHAGRTMALVETSLPYEVDDLLDTVGVHDFGGSLSSAMTAHPKICPGTGEMHLFGYEWSPPFVRYHIVDAAGQLVFSRDVNVAGATMMHDFSLTTNYVVFFDLPIVFDLALARSGSALPYRFDRSYGARLGVLSRHRLDDAVRWFDIDPCYVFHAMNAHDDGATITIDVCRDPSPTIERSANLDAVLWRWSIDLSAGVIGERQLDDRPGDLPRIDDRLTGQVARAGWTTSMPEPGDTRSGGSITVYDLVGETSRTHTFAPGRVPGEAVFVGAEDCPGGPGWLLASSTIAAATRVTS